MPRYRQVIERLTRDIRSGRYAAGQKLPSEAALVKQFGTSRITVGRALRELTARGLVTRVAGSGTYVRGAEPAADLLFGLLIPDLGETEIFDPICHGIATAHHHAAQHALLWGHAAAANPEEQALELCRQYIARRVSGVFFAPLERTPSHTTVNQRIATLLDKARIPVVLLDRCFLPYPERSRYDLVGIDNRRAGYLAAVHLAQLGNRRIGFIGLAGSAPTVDARIAGFREALQAHGVPPDHQLIERPSAITEAYARHLMHTTRCRAFVCANDRTAGQLMQRLIALGYRIPQDVRIVGMDDVEYASLLPVPLTTIRQPCREIGEAALGVMLDRLAHPAMLTRDILLQSKLVVRKSSAG